MGVIAVGLQCNPAPQPWARSVALGVEPGKLLHTEQGTDRLLLIGPWGSLTDARSSYIGSDGSVVASKSGEHHEYTRTYEYRLAGPLPFTQIVTLFVGL